MLVLVSTTLRISAEMIGIPDTAFGGVDVCYRRGSMSSTSRKRGEPLIDATETITV